MAPIAWYRLRTWVEGGLQGSETRLVGLASHQNGAGKWRGTALARHGPRPTLVRQLGCQVESEQEEAARLQEPGADLPRGIGLADHAPSGWPACARRLSCSLRGHLMLLAMPFQSQILSCGILRLDIWPEKMLLPTKTGNKDKEATDKAKEKHVGKRQKRRARERTLAQP